MARNQNSDRAPWWATALAATVFLLGVIVIFNLSNNSLWIGPVGGATGLLAGAIYRKLGRKRPPGVVPPPPPPPA